MENKYFDTIESVIYSQERRIFRNQTRIRKQYPNSLYGWCCSVRHGKSKRVKEWLDRECNNYEFVDAVSLIRSRYNETNKLSSK